MPPRKRKNPAKKKDKSERNAKDVEPSDDDNALQTPERDEDTDYGLDYTTSRLAQLNTSPRRYTLRRTLESGRRRDMSSSEDNDDAENQPHATPPLRLTTKKVSRQPPEARIINLSNERNLAYERQAIPTRAVAPRRKQLKPENRLQKVHREIVRLQHSELFMIPRLPFSRVVREIMMEHTRAPFCITKTALEAIQTATEMYLTQRFQDAFMLTQYRSRVTLEVRDMALVAYFCKTYGNL
ncbi:histone H3-like centromeric protein cid [Drosophila grimshawi]|uniref:GH23161 n=1 Tax=Drosophila grimshawi TaxID=7222 RepID=B4JVP9_DROGR|nr:histone H3-like centromeric protein cid [Drosophila grimshawi]EDV98517.1 GH23161 [Drosophila grimshawi]